jgi:hypothetical protein
MVGYQVLADRELEKPLDLAERLLARSPAEQALGRAAGVDRPRARRQL